MPNKGYTNEPGFDFRDPSGLKGVAPCDPHGRPVGHAHEEKYWKGNTNQVSIYREKDEHPVDTLGQGLIPTGPTWYAHFLVSIQLTHVHSASPRLTIASKPRQQCGSNELSILTGWNQPSMPRTEAHATKSASTGTSMSPVARPTLPARRWMLSIITTTSTITSQKNVTTFTT